jgi:hypothetical protein
MPVTAQTSKEVFIGAGEVYVDDQPVGATTENNVFRVVQEKFAPELNGTPGPLVDLDYIQMETAELEVSIPELDPTKLSYMVPGATSVAQDATGIPTGGGGSTTLAAGSTVGATNIKVTAITNFAIGDVVQVGAAGEREFRKVTNVGTAGAGGTGIDLNYGLSLAHDNLDPLVEVDATTLAADVPAGSTNVKVASVLALVVGDYIRFGWGADWEVRKVTFVGTTGAGGTGVSFNEPTQFVHRSGDILLEQTNEGSSLITSTAGVSRRLPSTAYHKWELRVPGLNGREVRFTITKGIMTENAEYEAADDGALAPRLTIQARWDPASITTSPWSIAKIGPTA